MGASHFKVLSHHVWQNILYLTGVQFRTEFLDLGTTHTWGYIFFVVGGAVLSTIGYLTISLAP